jgi:RimK family alpha-L-glutamate ligase
MFLFGIILSLFRFANLLVGIVGGTESSWAASQLRTAFRRRDVLCRFLKFHRLIARVGYEPKVSYEETTALNGLSAMIVRPIGRGSLEEVVFRMDLLRRLSRQGVFVVNSPAAIERCVDKYFALTLLEEEGIPVPRTLATESSKQALRGFHELGGDVVVKPLFGSRGVGATRITDAEIATRIFSSMSFHHAVHYLQEYVPHGTSDIRAFVVGDKVVAAMKRVGDSWKANVSQGARPKALHPSKGIAALAIKAAMVLDCKVAGVDILESEAGPLVTEVNSQPGWRGLQSVSQADIAGTIADFVVAEN